MTDAEQTTIQLIKGRIRAMIAERNERAALPSRYWLDFCERFAYVLDLPDHYYAGIRAHSFHLTGDHYATYYFGDVQRFIQDSGLEALTAELPPAYILNEPADGIGFRLGPDRFVSQDVCRHQRVVRSLYLHKQLTADHERRSPRKLFLEIGGGYGALAHQISTVSGNCGYAIVDLPETLLFSASYLALHHPDKRLYLYDAAKPAELSDHEWLKGHDFILVPNYALDGIRHLQPDVVINVASLQEMTTAQVENYLEFIRATCRGVFYSWNVDRNPINRELVNVNEMIRARFSVQELVDWTFDPEKPAPRRVPLWDRTLRQIVSAMYRTVTPAKPRAVEAAPWRYREYLCTPLV